MALFGLPAGILTPLCSCLSLETHKGLNVPAACPSRRTLCAYVSALIRARHGCAEIRMPYIRNKPIHCAPYQGGAPQMAGFQPLGVLGDILERELERGWHGVWKAAWHPVGSGVGSELECHSDASLASGLYKSFRRFDACCNIKNKSHIQSHKRARASNAQTLSLIHI